MSKLKKELLDFINKNDPIGLIDQGAPDDEYKDEVEEILAKRAIWHDSSEMEKYLCVLFADMIGDSVAVDRQKIKAIANFLSKK